MKWKIVNISGWITFHNLLRKRGNGQGQDWQGTSDQSSRCLHGVKGYHFLSGTNRSKFQQEQGPFPGPPITQHQRHGTGLFYLFSSFPRRFPFFSSQSFQRGQFFVFYRFFKFINIASIQQFQGSPNFVPIHPRIGQGRFSRQKCAYHHCGRPCPTHDFLFVFVQLTVGQDVNIQGRKSIIRKDKGCKGTIFEQHFHNMTTIFHIVIGICHQTGIM
mmetsp:Transcript_16433/g.33894  ORF Transcript_16433/g.33894 Transcript_16433/m.33894 type:complete len:216 (-) Transcript_16433:852-1499(-)